MALRPGWIPPRSGLSLIQEDLWSSDPSSEWLILAACIMLNCTRRKQVEAVLPEFIRRWPTPLAFRDASPEEIVAVVRSLGFGQRRARNLLEMTRAYLKGGWQHARELPGVGPYAAAAWEMFCLGRLPDEEPKDGALGRYWRWLTAARKVTGA